MKYYSHLTTALELVTRYKAGIPFIHYVKEHFRQNKKYGSRDRKTILSLCYAYFRLASSLDANHQDTLLKAYEILETGSNKEEIVNKLQSVFPEFDASQIFPFKQPLTEGIDQEQFYISHLVQPHLFLRIRPDKHEIVHKKLVAADVDYELVSPNCIRLKPSINIESILSINTEVVVQDFSSQNSVEYLPTEISGLGEVWDCCAGSGGKAIMVYDILKPQQLTVSDIRPSIITNLKKRFQEAGIQKYKAFVEDLAHTRITEQRHDLIIADLPCSGSGTWGRAPENLVHFNEEEVDRYSALQKTILSNIAGAVRPRAYISYITCSVFKQENEDVIHDFVSNNPFEVIRMGAITGYDIGADTMFGCLLQKSI